MRIPCTSFSTTPSNLRSPDFTAPVDDLLLVYLGQTHGGPAPPTHAPQSTRSTALDLWDYLGDFA